MLVTIFDTVLTLSLAGSVVALVLLVLRALFWRRLPAGLQYALWSLLVIRLLLPFAPASPVSVFAFSGQAVQSAATQKTDGSLPRSSQNTGLPVSRPTVSSPASAPIHTGGSASSVLVTTSVPVTPTVQKSSPVRISWNKETAALVWLMGVCALLIYARAVNLAARRELHAAERCRDAAVLSLLEDCKQQLKLRRPVELVYDESARSPGLFGVFRPMVVLSRAVTGRLNQTELRCIFLHELTHLRRRDNAVSLLVLLLRAVNWFNPVLHFAFAKMREDCEIACDASVLAALGEGARHSYGNTIVTIMQTKPGAKNLPGTAGFSGGFCKRRIVMIANGKQKVPLVLATLVLISALLAGCASLPARAQAKRNTDSYTTSSSRSSSPFASSALETSATHQPDPNLESSVPLVKIPYTKAQITTLYHKYFHLDGKQKNELAAHGYTKEQIASLDNVDFTYVQQSFRLSAADIKNIKSIYPKLKKVDISRWTYADFNAYSKKQDDKTYAPTAKQTAQLKKRGISLKLAREMLKDYCTYATMLAQPDAKLQKMMKLYLAADKQYADFVNEKQQIRAWYLTENAQ